jgi:hypothetical protein
MMNACKIVLFLLVFLILQNPAGAQELIAKVSVSGARMPSTVDRRTFQALQTALTDFLNTRKWTSDSYQPQEKIECAFLLTLQSRVDVDTYSASLVIQAARPSTGQAIIRR